MRPQRVTEGPSLNTSPSFSGACRLLSSDTFHPSPRPAAPASGGQRECPSRVPGLQGSPGRGEGGAAPRSRQKPAVPGHRLARPAPGRRGPGGGECPVEAGKLSAEPRVSPPPGPGASRAALRPTTRPPASLPSCRSSRTVAAAAREPSAPCPAPAPPPSSAAMLSGPAVMTSRACQPRW